MPPLIKTTAMKKISVFILIIFLFGCEKASYLTAAPSGKGGSLARFTIVGNYLYTVDKKNLNVFDITNPSQPVFRRSVNAGFEIETVFPFKDKLFLGSTSVIHIFSIDDPSNPQKLSEAISPTVMRRCDPVVAKDTVAYATLRTNGPCGGTESVLASFDIRDVQHPVQKSLVTVGEPYGLGYSGNTLYVCDNYQGLIVFDITNAYQPARVRNIYPPGGNFIDVIPYGSILVCWTSSGVNLYDISNPQNPTLVKQIN
jgi:hypothetical protein